jgi:hypothetical protein
MAIDTDTKKLAVMEWCSVWEPALPLAPGTLDQADQQQLLWGYPGILWAAPAEPAGVGGSRLLTLFVGGA